MRSDVVDLRGFYGGPLGQLATRTVGAVIAQRWQDHRDAIMLGIGYSTPYLEPFRAAANRVLALMPEGQGVVHWPASGPSATALADTGMLPLPDQTVDFVLLVHALETDDSPPDLLSEVWRILNPGGRLIAVVPNRRGLWARMDTTPFGQGQPFSRGQLTRLMRESLFSPIYWTELLYMPPVRRRFFWRTATAWEKVGATLSLPFAGVHLIEATKLLYRPAPVRASRRAAIRFQPVLVPSTRKALTP
jgi:SAM-dependent methyltransferase